MYVNYSIYQLQTSALTAFCGFVWGTQVYIRLWAFEEMFMVLYGVEVFVLVE